MMEIFQTLKQIRSEGIEGYFAIKYAEFAKDTPAMRESYAELAERVAAVINQGIFLEIGSGPAFISIEIARRVPQAQITCLDISQTMIDIGTGNAAEAGLSERIMFRLGNATDLPFPDTGVDFAVAGGSLHHWSNPVRVFNEVYRVLKPGKPALISDLRKDAPKEKVDEFCGYIKSRFMRWGLRKSVSEAYTPDSISELLGQTQFKKAERIELDDPFGLDMLIWLRRPAGKEESKLG